MLKTALPVNPPIRNHYSTIHGSFSSNSGFSLFLTLHPKEVTVGIAVGRVVVVLHSGWMPVSEGLHTGHDLGFESHWSDNSLISGLPSLECNSSGLDCLGWMWIGTLLF